jgi:hypothetical protein
MNGKTSPYQRSNIMKNGLSAFIEHAAKQHPERFQPAGIHLLTGLAGNSLKLSKYYIDLQYHI